jgi:hypothetical protein
VRMAFYRAARNDYDVTVDEFDGGARDLAKMPSNIDSFLNHASRVYRGGR